MTCFTSAMSVEKWHRVSLEVLKKFGSEEFWRNSFTRQLHGTRRIQFKPVTWHTTNTIQTTNQDPVM